MFLSVCLNTVYSHAVFNPGELTVQGDGPDGDIAVKVRHPHADRCSMSFTPQTEGWTPGASRVECTQNLRMIVSAARIQSVIIFVVAPLPLCHS